MLIGCLFFSILESIAMYNINALFSHWVPCSCLRPWLQTSLPLLKKFGIQAGGWVNAGISLNTNNPTDGFNGPVTLPTAQMNCN